MKNLLSFLMALVLFTPQAFAAKTFEIAATVNDDANVVEPTETTEAVVEPTNIAEESNETSEAPVEDTDANIEDETTTEKPESSEEK